MKKQIAVLAALALLLCSMAAFAENEPAAAGTKIDCQIVDGSYVLQTKDRKEIRGEAYRIADGKIQRICGAGEVCII